jgi:oligopeptide/dipeptide ABC transporter ATP-binding protein
MVAGVAQGERLTPIPGQPPDLFRLPPGCAFAPRCARVQEACRQAVPRVDAGAARSAACLFPLEGPVSAGLEASP